MVDLATHYIMYHIMYETVSTAVLPSIASSQVLVCLFVYFSDAAVVGKKSEADGGGGD